MKPEHRLNGQECKEHCSGKSTTLKHVFDLQSYISNLELAWQRQKLGQGGLGKPTQPWFQHKS